MIRVLVTGAGGPAGIAVIRSLLARADTEVVAGDMDGWASGLYLVDPERRRVLQPGLSKAFVDDVIRIVAEDEIDVVVSTVDVELEPLSRRRGELGAALAAPSSATLAVTLDKWKLVERCAPLAHVPTTRLLDEAGASADWCFPVIVKPRRGAGSRGVHLVRDRDALTALAPDLSVIVQEYLPGQEFSVDVFADASGTVVAAVPRYRARVDSGVAIAGRTLHDERLESTATAVAEAIELTGVANVQLRLDVNGVPALLEVNPRFPGSMPLTMAAGVDMPSLAVDLALGLPVPTRIPFDEVANVRYLADVFLEPSAILRSEFAGHDEELPGE
jgi:carbamoyl-phosphate synthase large subunit